MVNTRIELLKQIHYKLKPIECSAVPEEHHLLRKIPSSLKPPSQVPLKIVTTGFALAENDTSMQKFGAEF